MRLQIALYDNVCDAGVRRAVRFVALAQVLLTARSVPAVDLRSGDLLITHGDIDFGQQLTLSRVDPLTANAETVTTFAHIDTEELESVAVSNMGRIFVLTGDPSAVTRVHSKMGAIDVLSSSDLGVGSGPGLSEDPADIGLLAGGEIAVLDLDNSRILEVLPATGLRSILSDGSGGPSGTEGPVGLGPDFINPWAMATNGSTLFVADQSGAIFQVDPTTGNRSVIADELTGAGPPLRGIDALAIMPDGSLLAADEDAPFSLLNIDPTSGDRTILSDSSIGDGPMPAQVQDIAVGVLGYIYVIDEENLFHIDPQSGARKLVALPLDPPGRHLTNVTAVHRVPEPPAALLLLLAVSTLSCLR